MVAEWECGVGAVAEMGSRLHGPAAEDGGAGSPDAFEEVGAGGAGGADDDVALEFAGEELPVLGGEGRDDLTVDLGEGEGCRVEHGGEPGTGECAEDFLGFSEGIGEEDGDAAVSECVGAKGEDLIEDLLGGWKFVAWEAESGLHHEGFGMKPAGGFARGVGAEGEVAGVKE